MAPFTVWSRWSGKKERQSKLHRNIRDSSNSLTSGTTSPIRLMRWVPGCSSQSHCRGWRGIYHWGWENYFLYAWGAVGGPHTTYGHLKTSDFLANDKGEEPIANDEVATNDEVVVEPETNDEVDLVPSTLADDNSAAVNNGAVLATTMMMVVVFGITLLL